MFSPMERKGRKKTSTTTTATTTPECSHSCNWICAFCVSWNEWVAPLWNTTKCSLPLMSSHFQVYSFPQVVIPFLTVVSNLTETSPQGLQQHMLSFNFSAVNSEYPNLVRSHEPSSSWLGQWTEP
jgi:hypothetical protein